jgi:hypothetical protein
MRGLPNYHLISNRGGQTSLVTASDSPSQSLATLYGKVYISLLRLGGGGQGVLYIRTHSWAENR